MKTRLSRQCLTICLGLLVLLLCTTWVNAQSPAIVQLVSPDKIVTPGETFDVIVQVSNATSAFAAEVSMTFDPHQLQVLDADNGQEGIQIFPGDLLDPDHGFVAANRVDNEAGAILYALTLLSPALPVDGDGNLATITFRIVSNGETEIVLKQVLLATRDGIALPVNIDNAVMAITIDSEAPAEKLVPSNPSPGDSGKPLPPVVSSPNVYTPFAIPWLPIVLGAGTFLLIGGGIACTGLVLWLYQRRKRRRTVDGSPSVSR